MAESAARSSLRDVLLLYDVNNEPFDNSEVTMGDANEPTVIFVLTTDEWSLYASRQHLRDIFHQSTIS